MPHSLFLSVIVPVRDFQASIDGILQELQAELNEIVTDHEIIVVDNCSQDTTLSILKKLTMPKGVSNLVVFSLTSRVRKEIAAWVGVEASLGDYVVVFDPRYHQLSLIREMLSGALEGNDIVLAHNMFTPKQSQFYNFAKRFFKKLYFLFEHVELGKDDSHFRLMSRKTINFMLQHLRPEITYRNLPSTSGFSKKVIEYKKNYVIPEGSKGFWESVDQGMELLVSNNRIPMRIVTALSMFGAFANVFYSVYVILIAIFKQNIQPGWVTISLQLSGMFFLISLVLLVMGEYLLRVASTNNNPRYHVGQEFTSARMTRFEKINVVEK